MSLIVLGGKAFGLISGSILGVKIEEEKQGKEKKKKKNYLWRIFLVQVKTIGQI